MLSADWAQAVSLSADSRDISPKSAHRWFLAMDQEWERQDRGSLVLVEVRVRVRKGLQAEAPLHLLCLEDQQVEVRNPENRWDDLRHRLGCL